MNRQEFEHIIRACAAATSCKELLIVGSQAILGSVPDSPRELRVSLELDVSPIPFSEQAVATIDGNIGELSQFHKTFHIYAHGVGPDTATVPEDYRKRLVTVTVGGVTAHCISPIDLAYSKLAAGREKDLEFVAALLVHKIARRAPLERLIAVSRVELKKTMEERLQIVLTKIALRREAVRQQGRDRGQGMSN